jgi:hypothetical protein
MAAPLAFFSSAAMPSWADMAEAEDAGTPMLPFPTGRPDAGSAVLEIDSSRDGLNLTFKSVRGGHHQ